MAYCVKVIPTAGVTLTIFTPKLMFSQESFGSVVDFFGGGRAGSVTITTVKLHKYVCITTYQPDTKFNPNPNPNHNPTTKQHAIVSIQPNIVTCPM